MSPVYQDPILGGVAYPLYREIQRYGTEAQVQMVAWKRASSVPVQPGTELATQTWDKGWAGGSGYTNDVGAVVDAYAFSTGFDCHKPPFARLHGRRVSLTPFYALVDSKTWIYETFTAGTTAAAIIETPLTSGSSTTVATAVAARALTAGSSGGTGGTTLPIAEFALTSLADPVVRTAYTTPAFAPTANRLCLVAVQNRKDAITLPAIPTLAGAGMTAWTQVSTVVQSPAVGVRLTVFCSQQAVPTGAAALTVTFATPQAECNVAVSEFANVTVDIAGNGAAAMINTATAAFGVGQGTAVSSSAVTAGNASFAAFSGDYASSGINPSTINPGPPYSVNTVEIYNIHRVAIELETQWAVPGVYMQSIAISQTGLWLGFRAEIVKAAAPAAVFVTASIAPTANNLQILAIYNDLAAGATAPSTPTASGQTWTIIGTSVTWDGGKRRLTLYRMLQAAPTANPVTISFGTTVQDYCRWSIVEFANVDTGGTNGATAVVQAVSDVTVTASATGSVTGMAALGNAANATYAIFGTNTSGGITPKTAWAEPQADVINVGTLETQWKAAGDITPTATETAGATAAWGAWGVEIKIAAAIGAYATASITPLANQLVVASIFSNSAGVATPTLSGCGLTWVQVATATTSTYRVTTFRAMGPAPVAGAVSMDFAGVAQTAVRWSIVQFSGILTTGANGANAVVQSATGTSAGSISLTMTLAAFAAATNGTYGAFGASTVSGINPGSGFAEIHDVAATAAEIETEWKNLSATTVDASVTGTSSTSFRFAQGTYTGDGTNGRAITGLGFAPKMVVIKGDTATKGVAAICTTTSGGKQTTNSGTSRIDSLDAGGFTVSYNATDATNVNENGTTYYWYALGGTYVTASTFSGTGASNPITGLGYTPGLVFVLPGSNTDTRWRATNTNAHGLGGSHDETTTITSLDANGFTMGTSVDVNANGTTYNYVAVNAAAANLVSASYAGDGNDNRNLPAVAMGFTPALVNIHARATQAGVFKVTALAGDAALAYSSLASAANEIQSLTPVAGKFQVGTDNTANNNALTYDWFAFADYSGISTWVGVALEIQAGSVSDPTTGTPTVYVANGQHTTKLTVAANVITEAANHDFGDQAVAGYGTIYNGAAYLPLGKRLNAQVLAVGSPDAWTDLGYTAVAFTTQQDGPTAKIAKGFSTSPTGIANQVALASDPSAAGVYGAAFSIGSATYDIVRMADSGTAFAVGKTDNLYKADPTLTSEQITSESGFNADNGCGLVISQGTDAVWYTHAAADFFFDGSSRPQDSGADANSIATTIPNVLNVPIRGKYYESYITKNWKYSLYRKTDSGTTKTYLEARHYVGGKWILHSGLLRIDGVARGMFVDSSFRLWWTNVTGNLIEYVQLGKDGSPDAGTDAIGYGAASTTYYLYMPEIDYALNVTHKYAWQIEINARNIDATCPIQIVALNDGGAETNFGAAITASGVSKVYSTTNNGTRLRWALKIVTTGAYNPLTADPQVWALISQVFPQTDKEDKFDIIVDTQQVYHGENHAVPEAYGMRTSLVALKGVSGSPGPAPQACIDPWGVPLTMRILDVGDLYVRGPNQAGQVNWVVDVSAETVSSFA